MTGLPNNLCIYNVYRDANPPQIDHGERHNGLKATTQLHKIPNTSSCRKTGALYLCESVHLSTTLLLEQMLRVREIVPAHLNGTEVAVNDCHITQLSHLAGRGYYVKQQSSTDALNCSRAGDRASGGYYVTAWRSP